MRAVTFIGLVLVSATAACTSSSTEEERGDPVSAENGFSFNPSRDRSCTGGCAEGLVCDDVVHACVAEPKPPSIQFPISGAIATGLPALAWATDASATESAIEICKDARCTQSIAVVSGAKGASLATALPRGTYFARAWGLRREADGHYVEGATSTETRVFRSTGRPVASKTALAWFADFDADGIGDRAVPTNQSYGAAWKPKADTKDVSDVVAGGLPRQGAVAVPDMNGDGRTELAQIIDEGGQAKLVISRLDDSGDVFETKLDIAGNAELLLLGDVDRDGLFDLGAARKLADGVRLEIIYGTKTLATPRRRTVDVRMPAENGKPTEYWSVSAVGDLDDDGYPDLALGGHADTTTTGWGTTIPRAGTFIEGWSDGDRLYLYGGAGAQPFQTTIDVLRSEGNAHSGLVPLGDVDGDGVMDAIGIDPSPRRYVEYVTDGHMSSHWNLEGRGLAGGAAFVVHGGSSLRKTQTKPPWLTREGPAASWAYGPALIGQYDDVKGIRTITNGRAREEFVFTSTIVGAGDWDGDGFFDIAFAFGGAEAPPILSGETWDTFSDPNVIREYAVPYYAGTTTWRRFAAFVEVRYGSPTGIADAPAQRIQSPTVEASPGMIQWVVFPGRVAARSRGLFIAETRGATHMNPPYFSPFEGTYAGPPGALALVP